MPRNRIAHFAGSVFVEIKAWLLNEEGAYIKVRDRRVKQPQRRDRRNKPAQGVG